MRGASARHGQQIEQPRHRLRHERLRHDRDDAQNFGRHIEDVAMRAGIGLALDPGLLGGEIAVGLADDAPDLGED